LKIFHTGKLLFDWYSKKIIFIYTEDIKTTSPVSIILDGLTLQTVRGYKDLLIKEWVFLLIVDWTIIVE